jgi:hypothetical protein
MVIDFLKEAASDGSLFLLAFVEPTTNETHCTTTILIKEL